MTDVIFSAFLETLNVLYNNFVKLLIPIFPNFTHVIKIQKKNLIYRLLFFCCHQQRYYQNHCELQLLQQSIFFFSKIKNKIKFSKFFNYYFVYFT